MARSPGTPLSPVHSVSATDRRVHVAYELHVTNESHYNVRITSIDVLDARTRQPTGTSRIVSSDGQDVTGKIRPFALPATMTAANYKDQLAPGQAGILYVDLTYPALQDVPARIHHRFVSSVAIEDKPPQVFDVVDGGYLVIRTEPTVIAPPFKGSNWLVVNGAGPIISPHRYTVQSANGTLWPPEHFAIDFIQLNAQDLAYIGDPSNVKSWLYYGTEIAAVARGRVAEVRDNMPDQVPGQPSTPLKADDYAGNHVIVEMGNGTNALYAHLAPASIVVRKGEMVRTGQLLGKLGNTGNSDAPHLHFQIMDSPHRAQCSRPALCLRPHDVSREIERHARWCRRYRIRRQATGHRHRRCG